MPRFFHKCAEKGRSASPKKIIAEKNNRFDFFWKKEEGGFFFKRKREKRGSSFLRGKGEKDKTNIKTGFILERDRKEGKRLGSLLVRKKE